MSRETRWWWIRHAPVTSHAGRNYGQQDVEADFTNTAAALGGLRPSCLKNWSSSRAI